MCVWHFATPANFISTGRCCREDPPATTSLWQRGFDCNATARVRLRSERLVFDEPHDPACHYGAADEESETEGAEANHHAGFGALGDAEDDRGEEREEKNCSEV